MHDKLYVIGNGFDLHHGMPTQFSDFRTFARKLRQMCTTPLMTMCQ